MRSKSAGQSETLSDKKMTVEDLYQAIMVGAVERVRPKIMTVVAIMPGLLPIMWNTDTGSEVMRRIAAPMVGGDDFFHYPHTHCHPRSEEHTSELQSRGHLVCRLLLEKNNT